MKNISETPDKWVIIKIGSDSESNFKVFGSWAGGYLDGDRWRLNSGITKIEEDQDNYYFYGWSGSCYQCHKKGYGIMTSYSRGVLDNIISKAPINVEILDPETDWLKLLSDN